jgi:hypothetical protein
MPVLRTPGQYSHSGTGARVRSDEASPWRSRLFVFCAGNGAGNHNSEGLLEMRHSHSARFKSVSHTRQIRRREHTQRESRSPYARQAYRRSLAKNRGKAGGQRSCRAIAGSADTPDAPGKCLSPNGDSTCGTPVQSTAGNAGTTNLSQLRGPCSRPQQSLPQLWLEPPSTAKKPADDQSRGIL